MVVNDGVIYIEPGKRPGTTADAASTLTGANSIARLFARVINGVILFFLACCFWLATFIIIEMAVAGDLVKAIWPQLKGVGRRRCVQRRQRH